MINHNVSVLKRISQQGHYIFILLKNVEHICNEALAWLSPIFNQWGVFVQFFDQLIILMAKKLDFRDKIFIVKEFLELVK